MLNVKDLTIRLKHQAEPLVQGASFSIARGEMFCLVGESGSGKSLTALAVMGILDRGFEAPTGEVWLQSRSTPQNLLALDEPALERIRRSGCRAAAGRRICWRWTNRRWNGSEAIGSA